MGKCLFFGYEVNGEVRGLILQIIDHTLYDQGLLLHKLMSHHSPLSENRLETMPQFFSYYENLKPNLRTELGSNLNLKANFFVRYIRWNLTVLYN